MVFEDKFSLFEKIKIALFLGLIISVLLFFKSIFLLIPSFILITGGIYWILGGFEKNFLVDGEQVYYVENWYGKGKKVIQFEKNQIIKIKKIINGSEGGKIKKVLVVEGQDNINIHRFLKQKEFEDFIKEVIKKNAV